jgi:hypothetical protein
VLDYQGNQLVPFAYEELTLYKDEVVVAKKDGQWGVVDSHGRFRMTAGEPTYLGEHWYRLQLTPPDGEDSYYELLDSSLTVVPLGPFEQIEPFSEGFAVCEQDGRLGILNSAGELQLVDHEKLGHSRQFRAGMLIVRQASTSLQLSDLPSEEGVYAQLAALLRQGYASRTFGYKGVVDTNGVTLIPPVFRGDMSYVLDNGWALFGGINAFMHFGEEQEDAEQYWTMNGWHLVDPVSQEVLLAGKPYIDVYQDYILVKEVDKTIIIYDRSLVALKKFDVYSGITYLGQGLFVGYQQEKGAKHIFDLNGAVDLLLQDVEEVGLLENGNLIVSVTVEPYRIRYGIMDQAGNWVLEPTYELVNY